MSGQMNKSKGKVSQKSQEIDSKLEQLMNDRENIDQLLHKRERHY
jgi:hypothetical protein